MAIIIIAMVAGEVGVRPVAEKIVTFMKIPKADITTEAERGERSTFQSKKRLRKMKTVHPAMQLLWMNRLLTMMKS